MRSRRQAYRKSWMTPDQRRERAPFWAAEWAEFRGLWEQGDISSPELCARCLDRVWRDLFPRTWRNGPREPEGSSKAESPFFRDFLRQNYRGWPQGVSRSLAAWSRGDYPLHLYFQELSVREVLCLQAQGSRCVSLLLEADEIRDFEHDGRDSISFLIHDLIHADHLMSDRLQYRRQCLFSGWIWEFWQRLPPSFEASAPDLYRRLAYVAADMNSHLIHLLKTLKALVDEASAAGWSFEPLLREAWGHQEGGANSLFWQVHWPVLNTEHSSTPLHLAIVEDWDRWGLAGRGLPLIQIETGDEASCQRTQQFSAELVTGVVEPSGAKP